MRRCGRLLRKGSVVRLGRTADATTHGRQFAAAAVAVLAMLLFFAPGATADDGTSGHGHHGAFVPTKLDDDSAASPAQVFRVIVQGDAATSLAGLKSEVESSMLASPSSGDGVRRSFTSIGAISAELSGTQIQQLADATGVGAITADVPLRASVADPPFPLEPPVVSGAPEAGVALTASPGQWSGLDNTYAYQWQRCDATAAGCADVAGATGTDYVPSSDDVGSTLDVVVTASNLDGSASSTSAATAVVAAPAPVAVPVFPPSNVVAPAIAGVAAEGEKLAADDGVWSDAVSLTRQWQRCSAAGDACLDVAGATASTYVLGADDVGSTVRVVVSATDQFGTGLAASTASDVVAAAAAAAPIASPPAALTPPAVAGTAAAGELLSAVDATWSEFVALTRRWQRCAADASACVDIPGADGATYVLTADDVGLTVRVVETGAGANGATSVASDASGVVAAPPPPPPPPPAATAPTPVVPTIT